MEKHITKLIEKLIDMKWITVSEKVHYEGLANVIIGSVNEFNRAKEKDRLISQMFNTLNRYYPEKMEIFFKEVSK